MQLDSEILNRKPTLEDAIADFERNSTLEKKAKIMYQGVKTK